MIDDIPDSNGSSGVHVGATIVSLGADMPGTDLGFLGAQGCNLHLAALDLMFTFVNNTDSTCNSTTLMIPPGVPSGTPLNAQASGVVGMALHPPPIKKRRQLLRAGGAQNPQASSCCPPRRSRR
ncbi:MAG TPA: hypothetical protein EYP98_12235 [Planctomycetes bacterium]|nr:hypothetical protein [Planctomycetota bacterium]